MSGTTNVPGACVVVRDGSKILLILRENTGWQDGIYVLPSGHVEAGESFSQAASREVMEEVGLTVAPEDLRQLLTVHRRSINDTRVDVYFEATSWSGTAENREPALHAEVAWFDVTALPENIADYMKAGLQAIHVGQTYQEFGWNIQNNGGSNGLI